MTLEDHVIHLKSVLDVLRKETFYANLKNCTFCSDKVIFLGFVVSSKGLEVEQEKIKAIQEWPRLTNVSQVRSFHGLASFYRCFVPNFSIIAAPLTSVRIGAMLTQDGRPVAYFSEKLNGAALNYPIYDKEMYRTHSSSRDVAALPMAKGVRDSL
ncbi:uncharacterized mitochondrial protein AtMg00860-like [Gossypium arboreum]|uniref:uncharacterized mitochondrial protein AtMg00860-like n=1 Tax=Gossypium arboreum TaxID=29729 RepID=UPI0008192EC2|nr:uncharacterized mitochondrial protein AtMg00860-like [Gossypium arboreum]